MGLGQIAHLHAHVKRWVVVVLQNAICLSVGVENEPKVHFVHGPVGAVSTSELNILSVYEDLRSHTKSKSTLSLSILRNER